MPDKPSLSTNDLTNKLLLELPRRYPGSRLFRRQVGQFYGVGTVMAMRRALDQHSVEMAVKVLQQSRPITVGVPGEPDCMGWLKRPLAGEHVAITLGCEIKTGKDRLTTEQKLYRDMMQECGGLWFEVRELAQFWVDLRDTLRDRKL